jgi:hypothetical protein
MKIALNPEATADKSRETYRKKEFGHGQDPRRDCGVTGDLLAQAV